MGTSGGTEKDCGCMLQKTDTIYGSDTDAAVHDKKSGADPGRGDGYL